MTLTFHDQITSDLRRVARPDKAALLQRFFKTAPGEYAAGDLFLGVMVPDIRRVARKYRDEPLTEVLRLLASKYHEERLAALIIMYTQYARAKTDETARRRIKTAYLSSLKFVNNWDLVDISAPRILGFWLLEHPEERRSLLDRLAASPNLWRRRVAIISTLAFIGRGQLMDTLQLAERLLNDKHDLIHKAVGWALREVGKRDQPALENFLRRHCRRMPRTMFRYAIEKFPEARRQAFLRGGV